MIPLPLLSMLGTPIGKAVGCLAIVVILALGWTVWLYSHDSRIRAEDAASMAQATAAQVEHDAAAGSAAVDSAARVDRQLDSAATAGDREVGSGKSLDDPALRSALGRVLGDN